jgi:adenosylhomocysteine nucleosidase
MTPAIVVGMEMEARIARRSGLPVSLLAGAAKLLEEGAIGLISFGIAGGLAPGPPAGTLIVASEVVLGDGTRLSASHVECRGGVIAPVAAASAIVSSVADKRALYAATGAAAVDLESGEVARLCAEAGVPFAVIRVIADPAERELPPAALIGMGDDGRVDLAAVIRSVARQPGQIPALIGVGLDTKRALRALAAVDLRLCWPTPGSSRR